MYIRPATTTDIDSITHLREVMHGAAVDHDAVDEACRTIITSTSQDVLLVIDNEQVSGQAIVSLIQKLPKKEVRIDEVVIDDSQRGKGYGTELLLACEQWARDHMADKIELTSRPSRVVAHHLYDKLGYEIRNTDVFTKKRGEF